MRLIDADEMIKRLQEWNTNDAMDKALYNFTMHRILEQATIEPEQQWIPCSETIDIPDHEVLCCDRYGEELIGWLSYNDDQWLCESDGEMMYDPVAWMPLPEPWRGEINGDTEK